MASSSTKFSWREIVEKAEKDDNYDYEKLYPVVYQFSGNVQKRSAGPTKGIYDPT